MTRLLDLVRIRELVHRDCGRPDRRRDGMTVNLGGRPHVGMTQYVGDCFDWNSAMGQGKSLARRRGG